VNPRARGALIVAGAVIALAVALEIIDRLSPAPKGPGSSSYATQPAGVAAYASVLERAGHPVRQIRTPISERWPRPEETLIILDPDFIDSDEAVSIADWVSEGGRLVAGLSGEQPWLEQLVADVPEWDDDAPPARAPLLPVTETAGVEQVRTRGGAWHEPAELLPVIGPADAPLVVTGRVGEGSIALLADTAPLQNRALARADNAALGLALVGGDERPVAFLETVHGYGVSRGFGGLPARIKWVLLGLALTTLVALWGAGRRFGPTEDPETPLAPPRVEYVDALAAALMRAKPDKNPPPDQEARP
jgi:hypothetical protein